VSGVSHDNAVRFLGVCECPCHAGGRCWCRTGVGHPYQISHNDAVRHLGGCADHRLGGGPCATRTTEPRWQQAFRRAAETEQLARVRSGRIRNSADLGLAIKKGWLPYR
jgi:hypothetical protein